MGNLQQQKALLLESKQGSFVLGSSTIPKPGRGQVLVKIKASALNPVDWKIQKFGIFVESFPSVLGADIAGDIVEVGEGVTKFNKGDRVFYQGLYGTNVFGGFQEFALADDYHLSKIPPNITYDQASTLPVAIIAAYTALYNPHPHGIGLENPVNPAAQGKYKGVPIVILGGATSVGQFALQLAKLSGFSPVITTATLKHTDYLESLGATHVLNRNLPAEPLKSEISKIISKPIKYVFDSVSLSDTQQLGYDLLAPGGTLGLVLPPSVQKAEDRDVITTVGVRSLPHNVKPLEELHGILAEWLENGVIKPNKVEVLSGGLTGIVGGLRRMEQNQVSGVKLVAHPEETAT